ncbi:MAG TPA: T9SS type A sorting domain-containing protein [Candidatus Saccharimonadaceae bacterium]|jgi:hypothetical protein|nr:T9SS type A sorting domain-containing protein [Candidatus Saccharimonadaceae bacterium]
MMPRPLRLTALSALLIATAILGASTSLAQTGFVRNDAYAFQGDHKLIVIGPDPDHLTAAIQTESDFRVFTISAQCGMKIGAGLWVGSIDVDVDNDGVSELHTEDVVNPHSFTYQFPEPANGVSATHPVRVHVRYLGPNGALVPDQENDVYCYVTVYAAPRVYVDGAANVVVQAHNEPCANKIPLLVVEAFDPGNDIFPDTYYSATYDLVNTVLAPAGYEIFYLNFHDAGIDMRVNADVVLRALDAIHSLCPSNDIAVMGMSMGGVVTRYALAKREAQGGQHHVGLFVSFDSPQQAAHVNRGLQDNIRTAPVGGAVLDELRFRAQATSAKQLLDYNTYDPLGTERVSFFGELNALNGNGYPHTPYNIGISNGTLAATWGPGVYSTFLASLKVINGHGDVELTIPISADARDVGVGSMQNSFTLTRDFGVIFALTPFAKLNQYYDFSFNFDPVFVPSWSSLDLRGVTFNTPLDEATGIASFDSTGFDQIVVQTQPHRHRDLSAESDTAIVHVLHRTSNCAVSYVLPEGGSTSPETFQVPILSGGLVNIVPKTVTVNGTAITYVFSNWEDGSTENPRHFSMSHDGAHVATMKGHLVTTSSASMWTSNQRRITEEFDATGATYHGVYESAGRIWHVRNRRNAGWESEQLMSFGATAASAPAITTHSWGHDDQIQVYVAWVEPSGALMYRASNIDNGVTWQAPILLPAADPSTPVLPDPYSVVWAEGPTGGAGIYYYKQPLTNNSWEPQLVPGTTGNVSLPAVCISSGCLYQLAFIRDGKIYLEGFTDPTPSDFYALPQVCASAIDLTTSGWTATSPSVVSNGADLFVAWEEVSGSTHRIAFKQRSGGTWSATLYFTHSTHVPTKPVVGIDYGCGTVNVLWQCSSHVARVSRAITGSTWGSVEDLGAGVGPTLVASGVNHATAMWVSGAAAPYSVNLVNSCGTVGGGGGGCPIVDTQTAGGWTVENTILGRSRTGALGLDGYRLRGIPSVVDSTMQLRIREDEQEYTTLDEVRLIAIDHDPTVQAFGVGDRVRLGHRVAAARVTTKAGLDITDLVNGLGGTFVGEPGETLSVDLTQARPAAALGVQKILSGPGFEIDPGDKGGEGGTPQASMRPATPTNIDEEILDYTGILLQVPDSAATWQTIDHVYPRDEFDPHTVEFLGASEARVVFLDRHKLQFVGSVEFVTDSLFATKEPLVGATHSRLGDVMSAVGETGNLSTSLTPGDTLNLTFRATGQTPGLVRDLFLLSRGVYTSNLPATQRPDVPEAGVQFALEQNRPNPFNARTSIGFALPTPARVKLEIFDLQGRMIRRVADQSYGAGRWSIEWDLRDGSGSTVHPGVYVYRIQAGVLHDQKKMVLLP